MSNPNPLHADMRKILEGISFPEETVTVFLDADLMYEYAKACRDADYDPMSKEKAAEVERIEKECAEVAVQVTVKDLPVSKRRAVLQRVREMHPPKDTIFGEPADTPEGREELQAQLWALYVTRIQGAGEAFTPTVDDIKALRDSAPDLALNTIATAIDNLTTGAKSGYEQAVSELGFLSRRSQTDEPSTPTP